MSYVANLVFVGSNSQARLAIVQEKVINGLMKSLGEVKKSCSSVKLASKHALLIVVISSGGIHHRELKHVS
jgi:hypothetical protein